MGEPLFLFPNLDADRPAAPAKRGARRAPARAAKAAVAAAAPSEGRLTLDDLRREEEETRARRGASAARAASEGLVAETGEPRGEEDGSGAPLRARVERVEKGPAKPPGRCSVTACWERVDAGELPDGGWREAGRGGRCGGCARAADAYGLWRPGELSAAGVTGPQGPTGLRPDGSRFDIPATLREYGFRRVEREDGSGSWQIDLARYGAHAPSPPAYERVPEAVRSRIRQLTPADPPTTEAWERVMKARVLAGTADGSHVHLGATLGREVDAVFRETIAGALERYESTKRCEAIYALARGAVLGEAAERYGVGEEVGGDVGDDDQRRGGVSREGRVRVARGGVEGARRDPEAAEGQARRDAAEEAGPVRVPLSGVPGVAPGDDAAEGSERGEEVGEERDGNADVRYVVARVAPPKELPASEALQVGAQAPSLAAEPFAVASWDERGDAAEVDAGASAPPALVALRARLLGLLVGRAAELAEAERVAVKGAARSQLDACAERLAGVVLRGLEGRGASPGGGARRETWRAFYAGLPSRPAVPDRRTAHPKAPPWTSYERSHAAKVDAWETEDARAYVLARVERIRRRDVA